MFGMKIFKNSQGNIYENLFHSSDPIKHTIATIEQLFCSLYANEFAANCGTHNISTNYEQVILFTLKNGINLINQMGESL